MDIEKKKREEDDRKQDDDPGRDIKDPPVVDDEPDPTEPEGDPKPNVPPIRVDPSALSPCGKSQLA